MLIGTVAGAVLGLLIAWVYTGAQEEGSQDHRNGHGPEIAPADWIRLGMAILGVARQVGEVIRRV